MKLVKLKPYCHKAIWGGTNLYGKYGKTAFKNIAEAWELSGYEGKESVADGGRYDGRTVNEVIAAEGKVILGTRAGGADRLPILIKLIDAARPLSIQVHPSDENAKALGADGGKTEMWIICEAEPGAYLYYGVKEKISGEKFRKAILDGTITEYLNKVPVKKGDTFFIKAGTIHAIGAGITLCEIQQTSDTTYRLYDYKRKDAYGNERELHIEKGIIASSLDVQTEFYEKGVQKGNERVMVSCPFFNVSVIEVDGEEKTKVTGESFAAFTVTEGSGSVISDEEEIRVSKGTTVLAFAGAGDITLRGKMSVIKSTL